MDLTTTLHKTISHTATYWNSFGCSCRGIFYDSSVFDVYTVPTLAVNVVPTHADVSVRWWRREQKSKVLPDGTGPSSHMSSTSRMRLEFTHAQFKIEIVVNWEQWRDELCVLRIYSEENSCPRGLVIVMFAPDIQLLFLRLGLPFSVWLWFLLDRWLLLVTFRLLLTTIVGLAHVDCQPIFSPVCFPTNIAIEFD